MKITTLILALAMSLNISIPCGTVENLDTTEDNQRIAYGTLTYKTYHEDEDTYSMELVTEDGNVWTVNDYICNLFTNCIVTFDTHGTEKLEDDSIISIVTYTDFTE